MTDEYVRSGPVPVTVDWTGLLDKLLRRRRSNTVVKTYLLDPNGVVGPKSIQIASVEPGRKDIFIMTVDSSVILCTDPPTISPDTSSAAVPPMTGAHLSAGSVGFHFGGEDALWLNTQGAAATRVTVVKLYES